VLGGEGDRMVDRMIPLPEFTGDPDNRCDALMRSLMASNATCNLQVRIPVEPDLLQLTHEMRYVFAGMKVSADVESAEFQDILLFGLQFGYVCHKQFIIFFDNAID